MCGLAIIADVIEQVQKAPFVIGGLVLISALIFTLRPYLLRQLNKTAD